MSSLDILSCRLCLMLNGVIYVRNNYEYFVSRHCRQVNRCPFIIFLYFFLIQDGGTFYGVLQMVATCDVYNDVSVYITYYTSTIMYIL